MPFFKPGERAKLVGHPRYSSPEAVKYIGTEVTVVSHHMGVPSLSGGMGYEIRGYDGFQMWCTHECLERPKRDPNKKVAWETVPSWRAITGPKKEKKNEEVPA